MSTAVITPHSLSGTITAPPSKSETHRAIICALLSRGVCEISPIDLSNDIIATINAAKALGAKVQILNNHLIIDASEKFINYVDINCFDSASTLRFFIPLCAALGIQASFRGSAALNKRPINPHLSYLPSHGVRYSYSGNFPLTLVGKLFPGSFTLPGNISSQFVSGLLMALPLLNSKSEIIISSPLESSPYVDMTIATMEKFGVKVARIANKFIIEGNQKYKPQNYIVEGDWSQAAIFMAAGAIKEPVKILGLNKDSVQGDKAICSFLSRMGSEVKFIDGGIEVIPSTLSGINIYAGQTPDIVPILSVVAAFAKGSTRIWGASRLKIKESNRLRSMFYGLNKLGVTVHEIDDGLLIEGKPNLNPAKLEGYNDHRIVMALSIAACYATGKVLINDAQSISKSYPAFFDDYTKLGGIVNVINMG